ncbi:MAG: DUF3368 domain-containing protein [candidate division NC10 bacterium]|nr:DUF3368 domain-containing protein [candidate division NC10 bacterium]
MTAVADSTALISLASITEFHLLREFFGELVIPDAVHTEIVVQGRGRPGEREVEEAIETNWIRKMSVQNLAAVEDLMERRGFERGEAEAILLAQEIGANWLILDEDDKGPRRYAQELGLRVIGTLGILLLAKKAGHIESVKEKLEELKAGGFWIDPELNRHILSAAGEA